MVNNLIKRFLPQLNVKPVALSLPIISQGKMIPKVIHQTFPNENLPVFIKSNIERIKFANPNWEYRFYSDQDVVKFIQEEYGDRILLYFNRINPIYGAARADLFRYLLMYKVGGVYLDIKSSLSKPLDDVLLADDRYLLSFWANKAVGQHQGWGLHPEVSHINGGEFQQWHIMAARGHPFLRAVIANVLRNIDVYNPLIHGAGQRGVLRVTGPVAYTLAIAPLLELYQHRLLVSNNELGLDYSIFTSENGLSHKSLFKHHYTQLSEPVVTIGPSKRIANSAIRLFFNAIGSRRFLNGH